jgi:predicted adenine nucleotide alpha hydrolase (AANH) superfamily ATPase
MIEIEKIKEENIEYLDEVLTLKVQAEDYLKAFKWCKKIKNGWLVKEWGYILCIFYFEIEPAVDSVADSFVWIIVGDLPPAYIDIESASNAYEALTSYLSLMQDWVDNVNQGKSVEECFPIKVEPTDEYAEMLGARMNILKEDYLPQLIDL